MNKRKIISIIAVCVVIAAAAAGIIAAVRKTTGMNAAVTVIPVSTLNWGGGWYFSSEMEGYVSSGTTQNVFVGETETVKEVMVKEGQKVKKGDLILTYDTEKTQIDLEKAKLERERIQLEITTAEENLKTLSSLSPVTFEEGEDPGEIYPEENTEEEVAVLYTELTDSSTPFFLPEDIGGTPGTEENPYRFLCADGTVIYPSFINMMMGMASSGEESAPVYFELEIRSGNKLEGELLKSWKQSTADLTAVADDWRAVLRLDDRPNADETITQLQKELEETQKELEEANNELAEAESKSGEDAARVTELEERIAELEKELEEARKAIEDLSGGGGPGEVTPTPSEPTGPPSEGPQGMAFYTMTGNSSGRMLLAADDEEEGYTPSLGDLIPKNAEYTAEEIRDLKKEQEEIIRDRKLDLKEADLNITLAEKAFSAGEVRAAFDGVVRKASAADEKPVPGTPFIEIAGSAGMSIRGGIPEQDLGNIKEGNTIMVMSWESGLSYTGKITGISPYPDTSGSFSMGNSYSSSYYPFTAVLDDEKAELTDHEWVQISISGEANPEAQSDGMNLYRAFIRTDDGDPYVYKRGDNGLLEKQYVKLGKLDGDQYEILGGITDEDWVAFPYGKQVKEGARTIEGSEEDLYM